MTDRFHPRSRLWSSTRGRLHRCVVSLFAFGLSTVAQGGPGDLSRKFQVNEENPSANIPSLEQRNADPLEFGYYLQDLYTRAQLAFEKKEFETSVKYFDALSEILPERAFSFARACQGYESLGKIGPAIASCARAVRLQGATIIDHLRLINLILSKKTLLPADVGEMDASIAHVRAHLAQLDPEPPLPPKPAAAPRIPGKKATAAEVAEDFNRLRDARQTREQAERVAKERAGITLDVELIACRLGVRVRDAQRLSKCLDALRARKVDERVMLTFDWTRAIVQKDRTRATALLEQAKTLGIPASTLQAMAAEQEKAFEPTGVLGFLKRSGFALLLVLLVTVLVGVGQQRWSRSRRKLEPANQQA